MPEFTALQSAGENDGDDDLSVTSMHECAAHGGDRIAAPIPSSSPAPPRKLPVRRIQRVLSHSGVSESISKSSKIHASPERRGGMRKAASEKQVARGAGLQRGVSDRLLKSKQTANAPSTIRFGSRRTLSAAEDAAYRKLFLSIDADGGGTIDSEEMLCAMRASGITGATADGVATLFASFDTDGNGELDVDEFVEAMSRVEAPPSDAGHSDAEAPGSPSRGVGGALRSLFGALATSPHAAGEPASGPGGSLRDAVSMVLASNRAKVSHAVSQKEWLP